MEFKNKRILILCKETYSYPLFFLAKRWKINNNVAVFFFNPSETMYEKCLLNTNTYYAFKKINGITLYSSNNITSEFINNKEDFNYEILTSIEEKYSNFETLNLQIISSQFLTRQYHFRNYMKRCSYKEQLHWILLNYKNIIRIIDDFKPDVVIDDDAAELARIVMREVCYVKKIPYITLEYPRYEFYKIYSYNLNFKVDEYFKNKYNKIFGNKEIDLKSEYAYIEEFKTKASIMHEMYKNDVTAQYDSDSLFTIIKRLIGKVYYFLHQDIIGNNLKLKKSCPLLFPNSWEYIKFYIKYEFLKRKLLKRNKYFKKPEKVKYVYMPLHLIPESTTFTCAPYYINELSIIEAVSKSLPAGWWLYVKEHQAMVGERGVEFYKRVNSLPNVKMVQLNYYKDPKPWIKNAEGVITISGTSAYEAALLGKHSIIFSDAPFSIVEGVHRCRSFEDLSYLLKKFCRPLDNTRSIASYIRSVKEEGYSINMKLLLNKGGDFIEKGIEPDADYLRELNKLEQLYIKALYNYYEQS